MKLGHLICVAMAFVSVGRTAADPRQSAEGADQSAQASPRPAANNSAPLPAHQGLAPPIVVQHLPLNGKKMSHRRRGHRRWFRSAWRAPDPEPAIEVPYARGQTYALRANPAYLTMVALAPGEKIIAKASGDTSRWSLGETSEGEGPTQRPIIILRPAKFGIRTNIVITTNRHIYLINAESTQGWRYTSFFSWSYGDEILRAAAPSSSMSTPPASVLNATPAAQLGAEQILPFARLHKNYKISTTPHDGGPPWRPVRVFDDGARTYIEFPNSFSQMVAPPLFGVDLHGDIELLNYRVLRNFYVVDRIIDRAALRYGEGKQVAVSIERIDSK